MSRSRKIVHFIEKEHYLCNQACGVTKEKSTKRISKITCKNCQAVIKNGGNL